MAVLDDYKNQIDVWRTDPCGFAYEAMSMDFLTNHQEELLKDLADFVYANSFQQIYEEIEGILFGTRVIQQQKRMADLQLQIEGIKLSEKQLEYVRQAGFAISSGRDTGKSCIMAIICWWFLVCFEQPQGYILAPTGQQAKSIMMAEISLWGNRKIENEETGETENAFIFHNQFEVTSESIKYKKDPLLRFIEVKRLPSNCSVADQKVFLSGFHSKEQLIIVEEAVIFEDFVFETLNATNSRPLNWLMAIFNPISASSYPVRAVFGDKMGIYDARVWNCEDSNKPGMREQIKKLEEDYGGKENDLYRVNVKGQPPEEGEDTFISMAWLERATGALPVFPKSSNVVIGHDVAGMGSDNSATVVAVGLDIQAIYMMQGKDEHEQAAFLHDLYDTYHPKEINIDTIGIGRAVYVLLKNKIPCVRPIVVSKKPTKDTKKFFNQRAQHYWNLREKFKNQEITINLTEGKGKLVQLKKELLATKKDLNGDPGVIKIELKEKIKKRLGGKSPDIADACMLAFCGREYDQVLEKTDSTPTIPYWDSVFNKSQKTKPKHWMAQ